MAKRIARVFIAGDWDADGIVATSLLVYSQEKLGIYPLRTKAVIEKKPVDPEKLKFIFGELSGAYDLMVFLDLPYTNRVPGVLKLLKTHFSVKKIMYVDHHISSVSNRSRLEEVVDILMIEHGISTSKIVYSALEELGVTVPSRLKAFVEVVEYMDSGKRIPSHYMKLFDIVKLISKALTIRRDPRVWISIVDWLASPSPFPQPLEESVLNNVRRIVEDWDKRVEEVATDLAVGAMRIGDFKFVDARNKWRRRGATALASKLSSILKAPVMLWIDTTKEYTLLIVKAPKGRAYRIAKYLVGEGYGTDIAGHPNIAIIKIPRSVEKERLIEGLRKAVYYT